MDTPGCRAISQNGQIDEFLISLYVVGALLTSAIAAITLMTMMMIAMIHMMMKAIPAHLVNFFAVSGSVSALR